jgi:DinB superfamily
VSTDVYTCDECGFEHGLDNAETIAPAIVEGVAGVAETLRAEDAVLHERRAADIWSPLEYGAHLRDMLLVQRERVLLARRTERPTLEPMGRDERVEHDGYAEQDAEDVARQLTDAATMFANDLARLAPSDWDRTVIYRYPKTQERSLRWVAVHTLHEVRHHRLDIEGQIGDPGR